MGGFLLLRVNAGLNDALSLLWRHTEFAKREGRTIIFVLEAYTACNLDDAIDFSNYPVPVLCGTSHYDSITYSGIEPACFGYDFKKKPNSVMPDGTVAINGVPSNIDLTRSYHPSTLLVFAGCGNFGFSLEVFKHIKLRPQLVDNYHSKISQLPKTFDAVHLRATDHHNQKTEDDLAAVRKFVKDKKNVYLATDNMKCMESLSKEFSQIIKSFTYEKIEKEYKSLHHNFGKTDPDCLEKALIDILICATSDRFLPSVGGFSTLIGHLHKNKNLLKQLTSTVVDELQKPKEELTSTVVDELQKPKEELTSTVVDELQKPKEELTSTVVDELQRTSPSTQGRRKPVGQFFWLLQK